MPSPILALQGNIIHAFENPNGSAVEQLRRAIDEGKVSNELDLDLTPGIPQAPRAIQANGSPASLVMQVAHLELVWAFIYGWMVVYEWGVQRPMLADTFDGRIHFDTPLKERAARLLDWAASLKHGYTPWPQGLPSPAHQKDEEEREICLKANSVFQQAVAFYLFHEFAHAQQGHLGFITAGSGEGLDPNSVLEMEKEADDFAYRMIVSHDDDEETLRHKAWPILAAVLSSFYLIHGPQEVYQERHPHLHQRVAHMLAKLNLPEGQSQDYYHYLASTVLKLSMQGPLLVLRDGSEADDQPEIFDTALDALDAELDTLDGHVEAIQAASRRA
ncbi:phage exclusion protein Lit family protein [Stenotrophomonas sp. JC08]|uniref:phage exclusion protein Lit family protein n=1 Tax=Stenotrophomonas sp. JC08 TaxID=3445779 RepID=UPI003FA2E529